MSHMACGQNQWNLHNQWFESFNTSYDRICGQKHGGVPIIFVEPIPDSTHHHTYPWRFYPFSEVRMRKHTDGCLKWFVGYITILMKLGGMQLDAERCWVGPRVGLPCEQLKSSYLVGWITTIPPSYRKSKERHRAKDQSLAKPYLYSKSTHW